MRFGTPDRMCYNFGGARASTLLAWRKQGLPSYIDSSPKLEKFTGTDSAGYVNCVEAGPIPEFGPVTVENIGGGKICTTTLLRADDPDGPCWKQVAFAQEMRPTPGFETHAVLDTPVRSRAEFREIASHFDAGDPSRYPDDWREKTSAYRTTENPLLLSIPGLWMQARKWCQVERLCIFCIEKPDLVVEMFEFWADYNMRLYEPILDEVVPDEILFDEDIAFKTASFISPQMVTDLMCPAYRRMIRFFRNKGARLITAASDGFLGELIPVWLDVGINCTRPLEIAAGNDLLAYRERFGKALVMMGGIDKRELSGDRERIRREVLGKVPKLLESGGYIPSFDHAIPPDVPLRNYLYCIELLKEISYGGSDRYWEPTGELEAQLGPIERMWSLDQIMGSELEMLSYSDHSFRTIEKEESV